MPAMNYFLIKYQSRWIDSFCICLVIVFVKWSPHWDTLSWFRATQSFVLSPYWCVLIGSSNANFIVFGLTRPGLEPTIYYTRDEYGSHYTTNAVVFTSELNALTSLLFLFYVKWTIFHFINDYINFTSIKSGKKVVFWNVDWGGSFECHRIDRIRKGCLAMDNRRTIFYMQQSWHYPCTNHLFSSRRKSEF